MKVGSKIRYSQEWLNEIQPRNLERQQKAVGIIVGEGINGDTWRIKWDNLKTIQSIHKTFIEEILNDNMPRAEEVGVYFTHIVKDGKYEILHNAEVQYDGKWEPCIVYRDINTDKIYVRDSYSFNSRFKLLE